MKKIVLFAISLMTLVSTSAQEPDLLTTCKYFQRGYMGLVGRTLLPNKERDLLRPDEEDLGIPTYEDLVYGRIWGFIYIPSFTPEQAIYCVKRNGQYLLVMREPQKNLWYAARNILYERIDHGNAISQKRKPIRWEDVNLEVEVNEWCLAITSEQAEALARLLRMAVATSTSLVDIGGYYISTDEQSRRHVVKSHGLDGEITTFFHGGNAAECWSPRSARLKAMCEISDIVKNAVKDNDQTQIEAIMSKIKSLSSEFHALLPDWAKEYLELE